MQPQKKYPPSSPKLRATIARLLESHSRSFSAIPSLSPAFRHTKTGKNPTFIVERLSDKCQTPRYQVDVLIPDEYRTTTDARHRFIFYETTTNGQLTWIPESYDLTVFGQRAASSPTMYGAVCKENIVDFPLGGKKWGHKTVQELELTDPMLGRNQAIERKVYHWTSILADDGYQKGKLLQKKDNTLFPLSHFTKDGDCLLDITRKPCSTLLLPKKSVKPKGEKMVQRTVQKVSSEIENESIAQMLAETSPAQKGKQSKTHDVMHSMVQMLANEDVSALISTIKSSERVTPPKSKPKQSPKKSPNSKPTQQHAPKPAQDVFHGISNAIITKKNLVFT